MVHTCTNIGSWEIPPTGASRCLLVSAGASWFLLNSLVVHHPVSPVLSTFCQHPSSQLLSRRKGPCAATTSLVNATDEVATVSRFPGSDDTGSLPGSSPKSEYGKMDRVLLLVTMTT